MRIVFEKTLVQKFMRTDLTEKLAGSFLKVLKPWRIFLKFESLKFWELGRFFRTILITETNGSHNLFLRTAQHWFSLVYHLVQAFRILTNVMRFCWKTCFSKFFFCQFILAKNILAWTWNQCTSNSCKSNCAL